MIDHFIITNEILPGMTATTTMTGATRSHKQTEMYFEDIVSAFTWRILDVLANFKWNIHARLGHMNYFCCDVTILGRDAFNVDTRNRHIGTIKFISFSVAGYKIDSLLTPIFKIHHKEVQKDDFLALCWQYVQSNTIDNGGNNVND